MRERANSDHGVSFSLRTISAVLLASAMLASAAMAQGLADASDVSAARSGGQLGLTLDAYLQKSVRYDQFSGTVLLARNGEPVFVRGYGMANLELGVPNGEVTVFRLASITKQFTAVAILQLEERGKLKLEDPICGYLASCPTAWSAITIRHLLNHTSGIPNFSSLPNWDEMLSKQDYSPAELAALFRDLPLRFTPGSKFEYSNSGYHLLGMIVEKASGQAWDSYVGDHIFRPLGMTHSGYETTHAIIPNRASGYYSLGTGFVNAPYMSPSVAYAAGGLYSTVGDMLLWDRALTPGRLISRTSLDAMFTPALNGYGFGWRIGRKFDRPTVDHSGSLNGFSTYIARFPDDRLTVIVLSNSDRASAAKVGNAMAAITFGKPYDEPVAQLRDVLWDEIIDKGVTSALVLYADLKRRGAKMDFDDEELVDLGYDLIEARRYADADAIFRFSLGMFPKSAYSYDGLADSAAARGNSRDAVAFLAKSLAIDPDNEYARKALERLHRGGIDR